MGDDGIHALVSRALEDPRLPRPPRYSPELLEEAISEVDPAEPRLDEFKREFDFAVVRVWEHVKSMESWAPANAIEDKARAIANAAESLVKHLSEIPQPLAHYLSNGTACHMGHVDIDALLKALEPLAEEARFHADNRLKKDGARPRSPAKEYAVEAPHRLICAFSSRPPRDYKDGPFFVVSEILYKAASKQKADLSRYCREFLQKSHTNGG